MQTRAFPKVSGSGLYKQEHLDYSRGISSYIANDDVDPKYLVYATDARISTLGRYKTRKGASFYTTPAGETVDQQITSATGASEYAITVTTWIAQKFTAGANGRLTKVALELRNTSAGTGPLIIEIRDDNAGAVGTTILGQTSIPPSDITGSLTYVNANLIDAPSVASGTSYWIVAHIQLGGTHQYNWGSTTVSTLASTSADSGITWTPASFSMHIKTYVSTASATLGLYRAYKSDGTKTTLLAHGTNLYTVNDGTGALSSIKSGLSSSASGYRFAVANDIVYYVNGVDAPRKWDFTTEAAVTTNTTPSINILVHKNQLFYVSAADPTKLFWSDIGAFETYTSTNFLYVPSTKSPDPIVALASLNDNLYIFTRKKKYVLTGSDISNFALRLATGQKGSYSQDSVSVTRNYIYFVSDDGAYKFNGSTDMLISANVTDKFLSITDNTKALVIANKNRVYFYYTPAGAAGNQKCLVYNSDFDSWESEDLSTYFGKAINWSGAGDNNEYITASNLVGALYYNDVTANNYSNLGKKLTFELRTRYEYFDSPAGKSRVKRWLPRFAATTNVHSVSCQYDKDFANSPTSQSVALLGSGTTWGGGYLWGSTFLWGTTALIKPRLSVPGTSNYTQLRYYNSGVDNPVEFLGHTIVYQTRRIR